MKTPTYLYKDGKSILIDQTEVAERMAEGWSDSPHAPTIEHEPASDPKPIPEPAPAPEQPQEAPDVPRDPEMNQALNVPAGLPNPQE